MNSNCELASMMQSQWKKICWILLALNIKSIVNLQPYLDMQEIFVNKYK